MGETVHDETVIEMLDPTGTPLPSLTAIEWMNEAFNNDQATLLAKYGIDHVDIVYELIRQGYDYKYVGKDGRVHSSFYPEYIRDRFSDDEGDE